MKKILFSSLLIICFSGCLSKNISIYQVSGPAGTAGVIKARATGLERASGQLTATLPNGAACTGSWSSTVSAGKTIASYSWDSRRGVSADVTRTTGIPSGMNPGSAFLNCSDGTSIAIEFVTGTAKSGFGEGRDNRGNVYRVII